MSIEVSCVIKVGGSLFDLPDLPSRLANFLADFSRPRPVATAGGGPAVGVIQGWSRLHTLREETAHWLAVKALTLSSLMLAEAFPGFRRVTSAAQFPDAWSENRIPLLDPSSFLEDMDAGRLPRRWIVTSDSIAARMADHLRAPELVLLKSVTPEEGMTLEAAARSGIVDAYFPTAARDVPRIVVVNLREDEPHELALARASVAG